MLGKFPSHPSFLGKAIGRVSKDEVNRFRWDCRENFKAIALIDLGVGSLGFYLPIQ